MQGWARRGKARQGKVFNTTRKKKMAHKYRVAYVAVRLPGDGFTKEEFTTRESEVRELIAASDLGYTDALLIHSILRSEDGGQSHVIASIDGGSPEPLSAIEEFKCWSLLARRLGLAEGLDRGRQSMAWSVWEAVCLAVSGKSHTQEEARAVDRHNSEAARKGKDVN